jgi:hypothetical protein
MMWKIKYYLKLIKIKKGGDKKRLSPALDAVV